MDLKKTDSSSGLGSNKDPIGKITGFFLFRNLINSYSQDKNLNDNERKNIKKYGVVSLILSIIAFVISLSCLISNFFGLDILGFSFVLMIIIYVLGGVLISILLAIYGFIFAVMQTRLNRKAIGIIGIIISILSMVASLLLIVFMIV